LDQGAIDGPLSGFDAVASTEGRMSRFIPTAHQDVAEFITRQNVKFFRAKLRTEIDPVMRVHVHALLLEEVKNLESSLERLAILEHQIGELSEWIAYQQAIVDAEDISRQGRNTSAYALLGMLNETMSLYEDYRRILQLSIVRRPFLL
jgi:hypothetical protein